MSSLCKSGEKKLRRGNPPSATTLLCTINKGGCRQLDQQPSIVLKSLFNKGSLQNLFQKPLLLCSIFYTWNFILLHFTFCDFKSHYKFGIRATLGFHNPYILHSSFHGNKFLLLYLLPTFNFKFLSLMGNNMIIGMWKMKTFFISQNL